jgi:hypothetical protein
MFDCLECAAQLCTNGRRYVDARCLKSVLTRPRIAAELAVETEQLGEYFWRSPRNRSRGRLKQGKAQATLDKVRWLLLDIACPTPGGRSIADIKPPEVLTVLRPVEVAGLLETTSRLLKKCRVWL